jgi:poly(A) polymerase
MTALPKFAEAAWLREGPVVRLLAMLDRDGEQARVVGGAVRNALLGEPIGDIDIATTALPEEVSRRASTAGFKPVPTGIAHGTITVVAAGRPFEVTTLREDVETFGRHANVSFGRDWKADAERRDFTMNALSLSADGQVHDYVGGLDDLAARRVRFIGDANKRIAEDYLRILRFFRFHAAYGHGAPDAQGLHACIVARAGLDQLSRERLRMELVKLLVAPHAVPTLATMTETGILVTVLGGVPYLASFANLVKVEAAIGVAANPVRRLGALGVAVVEDADRLLARLRLANAEHARLASIGDRWWRVSPKNEQGSDQEARALLYRLGPERFIDRVLVAWSRSPAGAADDTWHALATLPARWIVPVFPIRAADFLKRGVEKGPALGVVLAAAEAVWIAADFPSDVVSIAAIAEAAVGAGREKPQETPM